MERLPGLSPWNAVLFLAAFLVIGTLIVRRGLAISFPAVAAMGFAEMVFSVVVLYASEVRLGMLFSLMGYLITALMAGLSLGAYATSRIRRRSLNRIFLIVSALLILILLVAVPLLSHVLKSAGDIPAIAFLTVLALAGSAASGAIYTLAARLDAEQDRPDRLGGRINMADLLGSALGAMVAGTLMLPLWGFSTALIITAAAMATGIITWLAAKGAVLQKN